MRLCGVLTVRWPQHLWAASASFSSHFAMSRSECCSCLVISVVSDSMWPHVLQPVRLLCPWDSLGKSTEVDCHALLQGIFPTQGSNLGLLHCRWILYRWATRKAPRSECNSSNVKHTNLMSWTSICFLLQNPRPASRKQMPTPPRTLSCPPTVRYEGSAEPNGWKTDLSNTDSPGSYLRNSIMSWRKIREHPDHDHFSLSILGAFPPRHHLPAAPGNLKNLTCLSSSISLAIKTFMPSLFSCLE